MPVIAVVASRQNGDRPLQYRYRNKPVRHLVRALMPTLEVLPEEAADRYTHGMAVVVDVRTMREWQAMRIPGAVHIPLDEIPSRFEELDPESDTLIICAHGVRSAAATRWLEAAGFDRVANIRHGICRWPGPLEHG